MEAVDVRNLTCIRCPRGCQITVTLEDGEVASVSGNSCPRGDAYARKEVTSPSRVVTTTVAVSGQKPGEPRVVSVKTAGDVPKAAMLEVIYALRDVRVQAPVSIGDVVCANVCDTGVDVVATRNIA